MKKGGRCVVTLDIRKHPFRTKVFFLFPPRQHGLFSNCHLKMTPSRPACGFPSRYPRTSFVVSEQEGGARWEGLDGAGGKTRLCLNLKNSESEYARGRGQDGEKEPIGAAGHS